MKRTPYMSTAEMIDWIKIGVLAGESRAIASRTPEKDWQRKLKCVATYCEKITKERLACLDAKQLRSVSRRNSHSTMKLYTSDECRIDERQDGVPYEAATVSIDDLQTLTELAFCSCQSCPQGACVGGCEYRNVMHRLGIPVARDNPKDGECEFRTDNKMRIVRPQDYELEREVI